MSKIYREFEVQIPDEAKISYSDQRVYILNLLKFYTLEIIDYRFLP